MLVQDWPLRPPFTLPTGAAKTWRAQHGKILATVGPFDFERRRVLEPGGASSRRTEPAAAGDGRERPGRG